MDSTIYKNKYLQFFGMYALAILVNYFTPFPIRILFFSSLLVLFFRSKDDPFWIAFFYMIAYAPGYLFNDADVKYNLFLFTLPGSTSGFSLIEVFIPLVFIKAIQTKCKIDVHPIYMFLFVFIAILFFATFFMDTSIQKLLRTLRFFIPYTLLLALPALLKTPGKFLTVFNYFIVFSIAILGLQIYRIFSGEHLMLTLGGVYVKTIESHNITGVGDIRSQLLYTLYSTHILLLNVAICVYYLLARKRSIVNGIKKPKFIGLFLFFSFFSLVLSGNRGYTLASCLILSLFMLVNIKNIFSLLKYLVITAVLVASLLTVPAIKYQMTLAVARISTILLLIDGDLTAGGTLKRLDVRQPRVMKKFKESPIIGQGFSDTFYKYRDGHVANAQILMNSGVIGFAVFLIFISFFVFKPIQFYLLTKKTQYLALTFGVLAFMLLHSSSYMVFCYIIGTANYRVFFLLISFLIVLSYESKKFRKSKDKHPYSVL